jgi:hypothetical protein
VGSCLTAQLFVERPVPVVALQTPMLVHVDAPGQALGLGQHLQHAQIPRGTLLLHKMRSGQQLARRIVDRAHQAQHRAAPFQPLVPTPIPQHHEPGLRFAVPPPAVFRGAPPPRRADPRRP